MLFPERHGVFPPSTVPLAFFTQTPYVFTQPPVLIRLLSRTNEEATKEDTAE
jgi:hypothetical protein